MDKAAKRKRQRELLNQIVDDLGALGVSVTVQLSNYSFDEADWHSRAHILQTWEAVAGGVHAVREKYLPDGRGDEQP